jgi:hypothetical protein
MVNPTPLNPGGFVQQLGGAVVNWPATVPVTWLGTSSNDWFDGTNWTGGSPPTNADDVVIPAGAPRYPLIANSFPTVFGLTVSTGATIDLDTLGLDVGGDALIDGTITGNLSSVLVLSGTAAALRGTIDAPVTVAGTYALAGRLTLGNLRSMFVGGSLTLNGATAQVAGNFATTGPGTVVMTNPADSLLADGGAVFAGASTAGLLTAGVLRVQGQFIQDNSVSSQSFAASAGHKTVFADPAVPTASFLSPGSALSHFGDLEVAAAGGLFLQTSAQVNGSVVVSAGALNLGFAGTMGVVGSFSTTGSGTLGITNTADTLQVTGAAIFGGGSTFGLLSNGVLKVGGSFTQTSANSTTSFAPDPTFVTILGAAAVRVVNFQSPGVNGSGSHFGALDMTAASGGLTMNSDVQADGALIVGTTGTPPLLTGNGHKFTAWQWNVAGMTIDNAAMVLDEATPGTTSLQKFDNVVLQNNTATTMLDMTLIGSALSTRTVQFNNTTVPAGGANLYAKLVSSNGLGVTVKIVGSNNPTGGPSRSSPPFGTTVNGATIVWQ